MRQNSGMRGTRAADHPNASPSIIGAQRASGGGCRVIYASHASSGRLASAILRKYRVLAASYGASCITQRTRTHIMPRDAQRTGIPQRRPPPCAAHRHPAAQAPSMRGAPDHKKQQARNACCNGSSPSPRRASVPARNSAAGTDRARRSGTRRARLWPSVSRPTAGGARSDRGW